MPSFRSVFSKRSATSTRRAISLDTEYVDELRNKRFGLSDTVYTQIKRHTEAVRTRTAHRLRTRSIALAKLIGRRPDAEAVFRAAGRYMARQSYHTISPVTRKLMRLAAVGHRAAARVPPRAEDRRAVPRRQRPPRRRLSAARRAALDHARHRAGEHRLHVLRGVAARAAARADRQHRRGGARALRRSRRGHVRVARRLALVRSHRRARVTAECSPPTRCPRSNAPSIDAESRRLAAVRFPRPESDRRGAAAASRG